MKTSGIQDAKNLSKTCQKRLFLRIVYMYQIPKSLINIAYLAS